MADDREVLTDRYAMALAKTFHAIQEARILEEMLDEVGIEYNKIDFSGVIKSFDVAIRDCFEADDFTLQMARAGFNFDDDEEEKNHGKH